MRLIGHTDLINFFLFIFYIYFYVILSMSNRSLYWKNISP